MAEQTLDLRALVRDAVARHLGPGEATPARHDPAQMDLPPHVTHAVYLTLVNTTDECLIEPSVRCNHCGYCKTHGY